MSKIELHDALFGYEAKGEFSACDIFTPSTLAALVPTIFERGRKLDYVSLNDWDDTAVVVYDVVKDVVEVLGRVAGEAKGTYIPVNFKVDVDGNIVETERLEGRLGYNFEDSFVAKFPGAGSAIAIAERLRDTRNFEADMRAARRRARTWFIVDEPEHEEEVFSTRYRAELYCRGLEAIGRYGMMFQRACAADPSDWEGPCCEDPEEE